MDQIVNLAMFTMDRTVTQSSEGKAEYFDSFPTEAVTATLPAEWDVECRHESATALTTVTSHVRDLPPCRGINVSPPGRLPSSLVRSAGSLVTGMPAEVIIIIVFLPAALCWWA